MTDIDIATFRSTLAAVIAEGESITVTRYGRPVGTFTPVEAVAPQRRDEQAVISAAPAVAVDPTGWITEPTAPAARVLAPTPLEQVSSEAIERVVGGQPESVEWSAERIRNVGAAKAKRKAQDELLARINRGGKS
jgi:antitoxin (DNA-binding transcriptional repressor) of toxin-antitoxin stability system